MLIGVCPLGVFCMLQVCSFVCGYHLCFLKQERMKRTNNRRHQQQQKMTYYIINYHINSVRQNNCSPTSGRVASQNESTKKTRLPKEYDRG